MEYLGIFAERRQSAELQRREKKQRGRGVVQSVATRYVLLWMDAADICRTQWSNKDFVCCIVLLLLFSH